MDEKSTEAIMFAVCDICHYPYAIDEQELLDEMCERCPVERLLKELCNG